MRLLRAAEDDFTEIVTYIAAQRPEAAKALAQRIEKNLRLLAVNPYLGRVPNDPSLVDLGYRYLVVENYLISYVREERTIFVHRIIHGARDYRGLLMSPWRVTSVTALPDARLEVTFVDGTSGTVDMRAFLSSSEVDGTVFEPLRDPAVFAGARVVMGAVQWPNGADLAPDAMYDAIRESGVWVLD